MGIRLLTAVLVLIVGVLLVGVPPAASQEKDAACVLCTGKKSVACPTCVGQGRALRKCDVCNGTGKWICRRQHGAEGLACPNKGCSKSELGELGRVFGIATCHVCDASGHVRCRDCTVDPRPPCRACGATGRREGACDDCAGTGRLACLACEDPDVCVACTGTHRVKCPRCKGRKEADQPCFSCLDGGKQTCTRCAGLGAWPCRTCSGAGEITDGTRNRRLEFVWTACRTCQGKAVVPCPRCKGAKTDECLDCYGPRPDPCRLCSATGTVACRASGLLGYRAAELEALMLTGADHDQDAKRLFARARLNALDSLEAAKALTQRERVRRPKPPEPGAVAKLVASDDREGFEKLVEEWEAWKAALADAEWQQGRWQVIVERIDAALAALKKPDPAKE